MIRTTTNTLSTMKTLIARTLILAAAFFTLTSAEAAAPRQAAAKTDRAVLERNLERALNKHLVFPLTITEKTEGQVRVSLVVDQAGRVKVVDCQGADQRLNDYVVRKLERIDIGENPDGIWKTTHLVINFRSQKA